jgi:hypothetical protein
MESTDVGDLILCDNGENFTRTYTLFFRDADGVTWVPYRTCVQNIIVTAPALVTTCPASVSLPACSTPAAILSAYNTWKAGFAVSGGCSPVSNIASIPALPTYNCNTGINLSFNLSATDICNTTPKTCTTPSTFHVDPVGGTVPALSVTCSSPVSLPACSLQPAVQTAYNNWVAGFVVAGGCSATSNIGSIPPLPTYNCNAGVSLNFTLSATDGCNTTPITCSSTFNVAAPAIPLSITIPNATYSCTSPNTIAADYTAWLNSATFAGTCAINLTNNSSVAPPKCGGTATVTFTLHGSCGDITKIVTFTVNPPPVASFIGVPVITSVFGNAVNTGGCNWSRTRTYTATDACNNKTTCTQVFTYIVDVTPPSITCAPNKTIGCNDAVVFDAPTVSDNCGTVTLTFTDVVSGNEYTRTWIAKDGCNNSATCSQKITKNCSAAYGCSHGFWKNHGELWDQQTDFTVNNMPGQLPSTPGGTFITTTNFWTYFNLTPGSCGLPSNLTMMSALKLGGGGCNNLARQGVAALLGSAAFGNNYPYLGGNFTAIYNAIRNAFLNSCNCSVLASALDVANNNEYDANGNSVCSALGKLQSLPLQSIPASPVIIDNNISGNETALSESAFPNPYINRNFTLKINAPVSGEATIEFFTISGQKILGMKKTMTANRDETVNFKVPGLQKASIFYVVKIGKYIAKGLVLSPN